MSVFRDRNLKYKLIQYRIRRFINDAGNNPFSKLFYNNIYG